MKKREKDNSIPPVNSADENIEAVDTASTSDAINDIDDDIDIAILDEALSDDDYDDSEDFDVLSDDDSSDDVKEPKKARKASPALSKVKGFFAMLWSKIKIPFVFIATKFKNRRNKKKSSPDSNASEPSGKLSKGFIAIVIALIVVSVLFVSSVIYIIWSEDYVDFAELPFFNQEDEDDDWDDDEDEDPTERLIESYQQQIEELQQDLDNASDRRNEVEDRLIDMLSGTIGSGRSNDYDDSDDWESDDEDWDDEDLEEDEEEEDEEEDDDDGWEDWDEGLDDEDDEWNDDDDYYDGSTRRTGTVASNRRIYRADEDDDDDWDDWDDWDDDDEDDKKSSSSTYTSPYGYSNGCNLKTVTKPYTFTDRDGNTHTFSADEWNYILTLYKYTKDAEVTARDHTVGELKYLVSLR